MPASSLLRIEEHRALSRITLQGSVLDLGGERGREYLSRIGGSFTVTTLNIDPAGKPDITHDLERPLPVADASYDHALLINVIEHVFEYRQLLAEAARSIKPGGSLVIIVPFLFPVHPSPHDYRRFTEEALRKELALAGLSVESLDALGTGVFAVRFLLLERLLPGPLRALYAYADGLLVRSLDRGFAALARMLGKKYAPADYPLGYCVVARKP